MAFAGLRGSGSWGTSERPQNFREAILWANPNGRAPLTALLARARKQSVDDPQFHWWEETLQIVRLASATGASASSTALPITAGALDLVAGDQLLVEKADQTSYDNEIMLVSSVTDDTNIVVKRGQFGTSAAATGTGTIFTRIGNVFEEGSTSPDVSQRNPTKLTNYCQIFKTAVGLTNTAAKTYARTGDPWTNDKKRKMFDHSVSMELAFLFGVSNENTSGTFPKRTTGGLRSFLSTNLTVFATTPTEETILDALYPVFDYDSAGAGDERIIFAGNGALNALNKVVLQDAATRINFDGVVDLFGMKLMRWITPQGTFAVKSHPLLNTHGRYTNSMFVINPAGLVYRPLRDTKFEDNIQANDSDTRKAQWLSEVGLEVHHEETMAYLGNVTVP
jgi:hypothetical protein